MFTFTVTGKSPEELEMRINDNIKRGFKVIKRLDVQSSTFTDKYIHSKYAKLNKRQSSGYTKYQVIMGR